MSLSRSLRSLGFPIPLEPPRTESRPLSPPFQQAMPRHTHTKPPKDHTHSTLSSLSTLSSRRAARGRRVRRGTRYGPPRCCVVPITSARLLTAESARAPPPSAPSPTFSPASRSSAPPVSTVVLTLLLGAGSAACISGSAASITGGIANICRLSVSDSSTMRLASPPKKWNAMTCGRIFHTKYTVNAPSSSHKPRSRSLF